MSARRPPPAAENTQQGIRRRNLSLVLRTVADHGPLSRAAVAGRIGLTRAAVSSLVDELIRAGLLTELGLEQSGAVGRPGSALSPSDRGPCGIGAEVGMDRLAAIAVDLRGDVRARVTTEVDNRSRPAEAVLAELAALIDRVSGDARAEGLRPAGVAVAVPGLIARDTRTVVRAPNLGWRDVDLGAHLPYGSALTVDNEANAGALAELWLSGVTGDFVHVSAETGIGAAVVVEGRLLRGTHGFAGELGHVPVWPDGPKCACGGRGCLEQYAGEEALSRAAGLTAQGRPAALLRTLADAGDPAARRALRAAGTALGIALAGAVNLLDPRAVVLGGTLTGLAPWLLPSLERELTRRTARDGRPVLTVSRLGTEGPLLGAAHSVVRAVLDDPAGHGGGG
ncbi:MULTISPECIES: ROK family transcriptional regulator [Streptomyces]|uniref:ROK family transcriptional regulator n=1 Tax=Streptomyces solicathayae TaxID=3081768 RepID=A0ABZ0LL88_9ACTN|nr:ROK family transcriptional regulator [Streptomyces sp. HUAS YS2]WOX20275.1 ROK family transcriptional regulator [Streptomyces sp. HUAS YS2]